MIRSPKSGPSRPISLACGALALVAGGAACMQAQAADPAAPAQAAAATAPVTAATASSGKLDVLFMVDDSSSMLGMQQKLADQIPAFINGLQSLPNGLPDIHIAVVSSDMGAPGDSTSSIMCTAFGDEGIFLGGASLQSGVGGASGKGGMGGSPADGGAAPGQPPAACSGLNAGQTFLSNSGGVANYTGDLGSVLQCMVGLGDHGCGFEQQLSSVARALGADGSPMPAQNAGFLRPDAELAIIFLSNEDDCSAPANTELYSLAVGGSNQQNISNALGPIANYRCNSFGHLCVDPAAGGPSCLIEPPLHPPADAQSTSAGPTLDLTDCQSADGTGLESSVSGFVKGIKSLKTDPDNQIVVGAIIAPATPYTVAWIPEINGQNAQPGEMWPEVLHSCGAAGGPYVNPLGQTSTDGSFGDPAVRLTQFANAFGSNSVAASICDASYAATVQSLVTKIGANLAGGGGTAATGGTSGTGAALPVCAGGLNPGPGGAPGHPDEGLHHGFGCDVGGSRPGAGALGLLLGLLLVTVRRRAPAR
jgi:hypothetical protein